MVIEELKDARSILQLVKRRLSYFLLPILFIAAIGSAIVMVLPPIYVSQATILVKSQRIPADLVKSTITALASERLQVIQQRVFSRDNILAIVAKFNLFSERPNLSRTDIVDLARSRIAIVATANALAGRQMRDDRLTIAFTISFEDENAQTAARVANELVTIVLGEDARARSSQAAEATTFLEKESSRLNQELSGLEAQIADFRLKNSAALPEKLAFNMGLNERLQKNIVDTEREIRTVNEEKRLVQFEANVRQAAIGGGGINVDGRSDLETRIDALKAEIATKSTFYATSHPEMRAMNEVLKALERQRPKPQDVAANTETLEPDVQTEGLDRSVAQHKIKSLDERRIFLEEQKQQYTDASKQLSETIAKIPEVGSVLTGLERRRDALQKSLDEVNDKFAQARLGQQLEQNQQSERFEVIEQPVVADKPTRPNRIKLLALVAMGAVAAGGGLAMLVELTNSTIRSAEGLQARYGFRPLVVIPYIPLARETRKRRIWIVLFALIFILVVTAALVAVHFFYEPIDIIWSKIVRRALLMSQGVWD